LHLVRHRQLLRGSARRQRCGERGDRERASEALQDLETCFTTRQNSSPDEIKGVAGGKSVFGCKAHADLPTAGRVASTIASGLQVVCRPQSWRVSMCLSWRACVEKGIVIAHGNGKRPEGRTLPIWPSGQWSRRRRIF